jgi:ribosomal protein S15P/S13E
MSAQCSKIILPFSKLLISMPPHFTLQKVQSEVDQIHTLTHTLTHTHTHTHTHTQGRRRRRRCRHIGGKRKFLLAGYLQQNPEHMVINYVLTEENISQQTNLLLCTVGSGTFE